MNITETSMLVENNETFTQALDGNLVALQHKLAEIIVQPLSNFTNGKPLVGLFLMSILFGWATNRGRVHPRLIWTIIFTFMYYFALKSLLLL